MVIVMGKNEYFIKILCTYVFSPKNVSAYTSHRILVDNFHAPDHPSPSNMLASHKYTLHYSM
jgi:hypothetical protein